MTAPRPRRLQPLLAALALPALAPGALAQSPRPVPPPAPERPPAREEPTVEVAPLPNWSIRKEVDKLDTSMREYSTLLSSLSKASSELGEEFERYKKNPQDQVLASSLERKMAQYAERVMKDFDGVVADQDVLGSNFRDLQRKLVVFSRHLGGQSAEYRLRLQGYETQAKALEKRLVEMSVRIKEDPPEDPAALRELKNEFAAEFRRYRLQARYVNGYQRRYRNYAQLQKNMEQLAGLFSSLHGKFNELIENMTNERQYLQDSMRLQADTLRIKQLIRDGILGSEQAIGNVAEKLANLYLKVDAFTQVHERINADLNRFVQGQEVLLDVTRKIDEIGATGGPIGDIGTDMEKAIEAFYGRRAGEDGLLGVEEPAEAEPEGAPAPAQEGE